MLLHMTGSGPGLMKENKPYANTEFVNIFLSPFTQLQSLSLICFDCGKISRVCVLLFCLNDFVGSWLFCITLTVTSKIRH